MMLHEATVFIIDDDEAVGDSLKLLLETHGLNVEHFGSTQEFSKSYRPRERTCLVLDHHLPSQTGLDFLKSAAGAALDVPVILVTGGGNRILKARAEAARVAYYFEKPLDTDILIDAIFRLVGETLPRDDPDRQQ